MSDYIKDTRKDSPRDIALHSNAVQKFQTVLTNEYQTYVLKKSEKLASALYVITGFIPHDEPVRTKLRTCALDLISQSSSASHLNSRDTNEFGSRCSEIAAILETARKAGLISHMNAGLICDEYAQLALFVRDNKDRIIERGGEMGEIEVGHPVPAQSYKGHSVINRTTDRKITSSKIVADSNKGHGDRRALIIGLFKNTQSISIRDAVSKIDGVSEKTVQRELLSLVEDGVLDKVGERRWSTYRLRSVSQPTPQSPAVEPSEVINFGIGESSK